jgi:iron complex transport system ATP-binding protein
MISANNIQVTRNGRSIIGNLSIDIRPGKVHALIGPNGCGKSTAVSALAGGKNYYSGVISYDEVDVQSFTIKQLAKLRSVSAQSQRFGLGFTVEEVLQMAITFSGSQEAIDSAVNAVNIESLLHRSVISLSGGEQQRVTIAMALAQSTPYLLLDEPFSAQDVESVARISSHLRALADGGVGILLVAHMSEVELAWCDGITRLDALSP